MQAPLRSVVSIVLFATVAGLHTAAGDGPLVGPGEDNFDRALGTISDADRTLNYELFLPPGHEDSDPLPLVVYLHGSTDGLPSQQSRLNDTMRGLVHSTQRDNRFRIPSNSALAAQFDQQFASYLLVPKIPVLRGWFEHRDLVRQLIIDIALEYSYDPRRVYLTGFSDGGFATIDMIEDYPGLFAAGVPIAGGGPVESTDIDALAKVPLWFFHGTDDFSVDPRFSIDIYNAIIEAGGDARLSTPFGNHNSGYQAAFRDRPNTFYPWLFSQALPIPEPSTAVLSTVAAVLMMIRPRR